MTKSNRFSIVAYFSIFFYVSLINLGLAQESITKKPELASTYKVSKVIVLSINSTINPATLDYIRDHLPWKQDEITPSGELYLIKLNTPGGLVTTTKDILTTFGSSSAPVVVWVTPEGASATSAGAILSAGAHFIFMTPGSNIGAATPITMSGDLPGKENAPSKGSKGSDPEPSSDVRAKMVNDLVALVRDLGNQRGKNGDRFAQMINSAKSFTSQEAMELNIVDGLAHKEEEIFHNLNGKIFKLQGVEYSLEFTNPNLVQAPMSWQQELLDLLANPNLAYVLFLAGLALIYLEMQAPGGYLAGALGVICLLIAAMSFQVLPINMGALGLMLLGVIFLVLEIFVTSFGLLTLAAVISLTIGALFLFRSEHGTVDIELSFILSTLAGILSVGAMITWVLLRDRKKQKLSDNLYALVGKSGEIVAKDDHYYQIKVQGEIWRAHGPAHLRLGDEVNITGENKVELFLTIEAKS